jgi:hypothetical protein
MRDSWSAPPGFRKLITHVFLEGDQYLESDAVFAVKSSLIAKPKIRDGALTIEYDFGLFRDSDQV